MTTFDKVTDTKEAGLHFKAPLITKVYKINTKDILIQDTYPCSSKDLQIIPVELAVQYNIVNPHSIFSRYNTNVENILIKPRVTEIIQSVISNYNIDEIISNRKYITQEVLVVLKNDLAKEGINISNVSINKYAFSIEFTNSIEEKKIAEQKAKTQEIVNIQNVKKAQVELQIKELEAKSNTVLTQSLTPEILRKMEIQAWDGALPTVQSDSATPMFKINPNQNK